MQVRCAFYGLANQAGKTELLIEEECLRVGERLQYNGELYVILSVCTEGDRFHANVALESSRRAPLAGQRQVVWSDGVRRPSWGRRGERGQGEGERRTEELREQLLQAEERLQALLAEREEYAERLEKLIQQLESLHE
ncbi:MAG: hypothetical protein D6736_06505 [Nitrospinota bacterium]|nr:MAG: hypothetical protein D6736_06505 [Nitrospinota bacterium]